MFAAPAAASGADSSSIRLGDESSEAGWLGQNHQYFVGKVWRPVATVRGPHRKPLKLRGFYLKVRFDGSIAGLLDAGGWLTLRAGG